jgi:hypothetical protein
MLEFTGEFEGEDYRVLEMGFVHNGKPHYIKYDAIPSLYDQYLPIVKEMIHSFKVTK